MAGLSWAARTALSLQAVLLATALVAAADAEAKGGRRGGGSSSSRSSPAPAQKADDDKPMFRAQSPGSAYRTGAMAGSGSRGGQASVGSPLEGAGLIPFAESDPLGRPARAPEQTQALLEAQRMADEKAAADRAGHRSAEEKAAAAKLAAEQAQKAREEAALAAEVDAVLQRAMADYPVLKTPQGEPTLRMIKERQKVLLARGLYPSVAMVEAVADHADSLAPRRTFAPQMVRTGTAAPAAQAEAIGTCRWVTPLIWSCAAETPAR